MDELVLSGVEKRFRGIAALRGVSLRCAGGKLTVIIGPNGAGKTTLFDVVTGFVKADAGRVFILGEEVTGMAPHIIAAKGVGRMFQEPALFERLTVLENLLSAPKAQSGENVLAALCSGFKVRDMERRYCEKAMKVLQEVGLAHECHRVASELSYGQQKLVSLSRMLMSDSVILLLDEPTAGVYGERAARIRAKLRELARSGLVVVVITHDVDEMVAEADSVALLVGGQVESWTPDVSSSEEITKYITEAESLVPAGAKNEG